MNEEPDALIHLRVPAALKGRWVRASRAASMRLTDWIIERVERSKEKDMTEIKTLADGDVEVISRHFDGVAKEEFTIERRFTVRGAYVYQVYPNGSTQQACEGLLPTGPTLRAGDDLTATIRRTLGQ